jgi:DNA invertase Pin-like site-specific DNA recombinase
MYATDNRQQRAVVYLRVASARHEDQAAIARQREGCLRIADRHGLTVIREYADIGRPARLEQQIELLHLLDDLHQHRDVAAVIVWDYARLARSMAQLDQIVHHVRACEAEIVTITGVEAADRFIRERQGRPPAQEA